MSNATLRSNCRLHIHNAKCLHEHETSMMKNLQHVETNRLCQWSALASRDDVTFLDIEGRGAVDCQVAVTFLESVELLDVVQVIASNDDSAFHLGGDAHALQDGATDADIPGKRTNK